MAGRAGLVVGAGGAALLALAQALHLFALAYAGHAERQLDRPSDPSALAASTLAARLAPWSWKHHGLAGWILTESAEFSEAEAAYRSALRWAPADALLWTEFAQARARAGRFDDVLEHALRRAQFLAPTSPAVQGTLAAMGLGYWRQTSPSTRALLLRSMRYERDHNRESFLYMALIRGQTMTFCADAAQRLSEGEWCASIQKRVEDCRRRGSPEGYALCVAQ